MRPGLPLLAACAALALASCVRNYERYEARVDAYLNPAYQVSREDIFCFVPAAEAHPEGDLPKQRRYDELARLCADIGQKKGVRIFAERVEGCFPTRLDWVVGAGLGGSVTERRHDGLAQRWRGDVRKQLQLVVRHPTADESLLEASAVMRTDLEAFTDNTAKVLCRALLQDFPSRVNSKAYTIVL